MKRCLCVLVIMLLLSGCSSAESDMDRAMSLRDKLLQGGGCCFDAYITADYGENLYTFTLSCQADELGNVSFSVTEPKSISGITGNVSQDGGQLTFDDTVLAFETMADGQITPVIAPWLLIKTLRSGYLRACSSDEEYLRIVIDDSYEEDALQLDVWLDSTDSPAAADFLWQGRRIINMEVKNFQFM